ncbi:MAG: hypothetical protein LBS16_02020, partial [Prevotellaceae bacterium]|nr:hypothetical protein [Prevotellaceae bacterium]
PNGDGLYLWDGNKWNYIGGSDGFFSIPAPTCTNPLPNLIFASYNLGADVAKLNTLYPDLSPAKQQMKFLALEPYVALDVTVFGDWYQWGRVADGHEKPNSTTYAGPTSDVDANGQATDTGGKGQFIKGSTSYYDWRATHQHNLWGNGEGVSSQGSDNQGGVLSSSDGNYYQNTDWAIPDNNPCPSGWRVPTQDEWERLINYGCGTPQTAGGDITVSSTGTATTTRGGNELTWVPVKGGKVTSSGWAATTGNLGGYAVYKKADWDKAIANGGYFNPSGSGADYAKLLYNAAAPEPLLFFSIPGWRKSNTGVVYSVSVSANYWGSTTSDAYACNFALYNPNVFIDFIDRSYAFSVRCVKN